MVCDYSDASSECQVPCIPEGIQSPAAVQEDGGFMPVHSYLDAAFFHGLTLKWGWSAMSSLLITPGLCGGIFNFLMPPEG